VPERYTSNIVWTSESRNIAENIRKIVAKVPGFEELKASLEEEAKFEIEMKSESEDAAEAQSSRSSFRTRPARLSLNSVNTPTSVTKMPYNGAKKIAFNSHSTREKNSTKYSRRKQVSKKKAVKAKTKKKSAKRNRSSKKLMT